MTRPYEADLTTEEADWGAMPKSKATPKTKSRKANILFPGRPNYTGPTQGCFGLLHHSVLFETSHNVNERVDYIKLNKPKREISIRLHNLIYLGGCDAVNARTALDADYESKRAPLDADYESKRAPLDADYGSKRALLIADYQSKCAPLYADYRSECAPLYADYKSKRAALDADYESKRAALDADYESKRAPLNADYKSKRAPLYADYQSKCAALGAEILCYIRKHIPDCAWNGTELKF